jgi:hypothetical protein
MITSYLPGVFYRVGDYLFTEGSLGDQTVFAFVLPDGTKSSEFYSSLEMAMVAAVGQMYTGRRGAGGEGVGTAADWFAKMIGLTH